MDSNERAVVIIRNEKNQILIGKACNKNRWDLIKGHIEIGEKPEEGAVREAFEECGLNLKIQDLDLLGSFHYQEGLAFVFETFLDYTPTHLKCTSYFDWYGKQLPELSEFCWIDESELKDFLYKGLFLGLKKEGFIG